MRLKTPEVGRRLLLSTYLGSAPRDVEFFWSAKEKDTPLQGLLQKLQGLLDYLTKFFLVSGSTSNPHRFVLLYGKSSLQSCHLVDWKSDEFTLHSSLLSSREKSAYSGPPDPAKEHILQGRQLYLISVNLSKSPGHSDIQASLIL